MPIAAGTRLGTYEILGPLGRGGMGEVWRGRDLRLGREVAIKVLPADMAANADRIARFEREARAVAVLNHPNIVVLHSVEDEDGVHFLTMELVEGDSLDHHVMPGGLPVARVLDLGIAMADALAAAHARGVVHRDLKPANVMLTREGRVKVLDFGLAKLASVAPDSAPDATQAATVASPLSTIGQVMGTAPYMAPEQVRGEATDERTDLFALGILVYELAAGQRPFTGATSADVSSAILRDPPPPLTRVRAELPAELERVVAQCLEKEPARRIASALELCNELRRIKHVVESGGRGASAAAAQRTASIAVLPFVNRSRDEEDEYFSEGLADELTGMLAKIRGLRVAARTSAFQFKGTTEPLVVIGQKLNVATLLEGSVRKSGNRVRIVVQLVNVADGYHLWSETYDRTLDDIFAVQDDIAQSVVKELRVALLGADPDSRASGEAKAAVAAAARGRGRDPEAHRLYLQARYLLDRNSRESITRAIDYLKQALAIDPDSALGWAGLAFAYSGAINLGVVTTPEGLPRAREAAVRSLAIEPDLPEALEAHAMMLLDHDWDWRAAGASVARLLAVAPDNAIALNRACMFANTMGRFEEALQVGRRGCEQDPLSSRLHMNVAIALQCLDRLDEAEVEFRKAHELAPERAAAHNCIALALLAKGRLDEALAEARAETEPVFRVHGLAIVHHGRGERAEADACLADLERQYADMGAFQIAEVYGYRGELDTAFEWLDRAYAQRDPGLTQACCSWPLRPVFGDPRWSVLLRKLGLEG